VHPESRFLALKRLLGLRDLPLSEASGGTANQASSAGGVAATGPGGHVAPRPNSKALALAIALTELIETRGVDTSASSGLVTVSGMHAESCPVIEHSSWPDWASLKLFVGVLALIVLVVFTAGACCGFKLARWWSSRHKAKVCSQSTQSQVTYSFKASQPRFTPLPEWNQGCWTERSWATEKAAVATQGGRPAGVASEGGSRAAPSSTGGTGGTGACRLS